MGTYVTSIFELHNNGRNEGEEEKGEGEGS